MYILIYLDRYMYIVVTDNTDGRLLRKAQTWQEYVIIKPINATFCFVSCLPSIKYWTSNTDKLGLNSTVMRPWTNQFKITVITNYFILESLTPNLNEIPSLNYVNMSDTINFIPHTFKLVQIEYPLSNILHQLFFSILIF